MIEQEFLTLAEQAAVAAGDVLKEWSQKFTVSEKGPADLVTEADVASQEAIYQLISERFPEHNFLGEEGLTETNSESPYRWVIDPLDGTLNYVHRFPYYGVSIALQHEQEVIVGVIFDPNRDELFSAVKGQGAFLNGTKIQPSLTKSVQDALVVASLPVGTGPEHPAVGLFLKMMDQAQTVQRTGSAALNLAYTAAGRIDGFWSLSLKPWDMAAGYLLVTEAGGVVSQTDGQTFQLEVPDLLACNNPNLHQQLQNCLI